MGMWHETRWANAALRVVGLSLLIVAGALAVTLYHRVHGHAPRQANLGELGLAAVMVGSALIGNALLFIGPTLWEHVEVPGRRSFTLPDAGDADSARPLRDAGLRRGHRGDTRTLASRPGDDRPAPRRFAWPIAGKPDGAALARRC